MNVIWSSFLLKNEERKYGSYNRKILISGFRISGLHCFSIYVDGPGLNPGSNIYIVTHKPMFYRQGHSNKLLNA